MGYCLAPVGALTDTVPNSPERKFIDKLTDPSGSYRISPFQIDKGYQKSYGVWNYNEARNNIFRFSEAIEFIEQFPNGWGNFRPLFDKAGILDPLDQRDIPAVVKERMLEIKGKVEKAISLAPKDEGYCDLFVPMFYEYSQRPYSKGGGGLCFKNKPSDAPSRVKKIAVSTVGEAFKQCAATGINTGKCLVSTFMIFSAFEFVAPQCHVIATFSPYYYGNGSQHHIFAEYKGVALDPSDIGRSKESDSTMLTRRQLISMYHLNLSARAAKRKDLLGIENEIKKVIRLYPDFPEAHLRLGTIMYYIKGDLHSAEKEYRRAIQLREDFLAAHYFLGIILREKGDLIGAERIFKQLIQKGEDYPWTHYDLGVVLKEKGDLVGAEKEFKQAIEQDENFPEAHRSLGLILEINGKEEEAQEHFKKYEELTGRKLFFL